jgi:hypothetical protein
VASPESRPWWVKWVQMPVACPNTQRCSRMLTNPLWLVFGCRFKLDLLVPLPSLIHGPPTRPSTPFYSWKSGACLQVSTFRNLTLWNPRVGFTPWLGNASLAVIKATRKKIMKKRTPILENSSSSNSEVSLPPFKKELYTMLEATPKND